MNLHTSPLMETCTAAADVFVSVDSVKMGEAHLLFGERSVYRPRGEGVKSLTLEELRAEIDWENKHSCTKY